MKIVSSRVESERFGVKVGRVVIDAHDDAPASDEFAGFDITFVRTPADNWAIAYQLALLSDHAGFVADHLCYWRWTCDRMIAVEGPPPGWSVRLDPSADQVESVVRRSFDGYLNHYSANPLLADVSVVDAYAEWAQTLMREPGASAALLADDSGEPVAVAVIDWTGAVPDIRLAGVAPDHQRRGLYPVLLERVMLMARDRGETALEISTQSHNVAVMRAWTRLGFEPHRTLATYHVVRRGLLTDFVRGADEGAGR